MVDLVRHAGRRTIIETVPAVCVCTACRDGLSKADLPEIVALTMRVIERRYGAGPLAVVSFESSIDTFSARGFDLWIDIECTRSNGQGDDIKAMLSRDLERHCYG